MGQGDDLITYDVRGDLSSGVPLFMFASPMAASGFVSLSSHFEDRPVVTYDPRGAERNPKGTSEITPEQHADDIHRVIEALGVGPVDVFASSGGAVNILALCAVHPEDVRVVVAHEPPTFVGLPDEEVLIAAIADMKATYLKDGNGQAMAKFIQVVMSQGELPGLPRPPGTGPGDVRAVRRRRRQPRQPADAQHAGLQRVRGRRRRAGCDGGPADSPSAPHRARDRPRAEAGRSPPGSARRPCCSPATTATS